MAMVAACYSTKEEKQNCLETVLKLNPNNKNAKQALEELGIVEEPSVNALLSNVDQARVELRGNNKKRSKLIWLFVLGGLVLLFSVAGVLYFVRFMPNLNLGFGLAKKPAIQDSIIGEWSCSGEVDQHPDNVRWEFYKGGVKYVYFGVDDNEFHSTELFNYSFVDTNVIKIEKFLIFNQDYLGFKPEDRLYKIEINNNQLKMNSADGNDSYSSYTCENISKSNNNAPVSEFMELKAFLISPNVMPIDWKTYQLDIKSDDNNHNYLCGEATRFSIKKENITYINSTKGRLLRQSVGLYLTTDDAHSSFLERYEIASKCPEYVETTGAKVVLSDLTSSKYGDEGFSFRLTSISNGVSTQMDSYLLRFGNLITIISYGNVSHVDEMSTNEIELYVILAQDNILALLK